MVVFVVFVLFSTHSINLFHEIIFITHIKTYLIFLKYTNLISFYYTKTDSISYKSKTNFFSS